MDLTMHIVIDANSFGKSQLPLLALNKGKETIQGFYELLKGRINA